MIAFFEKNPKKDDGCCSFLHSSKKIKVQMIEHDRLTLLLWYCVFFTTNGSIFISSFFFTNKREIKK